MNDYWFRWRVLLSPLQRLNAVEDSVTFRVDSLGKEVEVKAAPPGPLNQASIITFLGIGLILLSIPLLKVLNQGKGGAIAIPFALFWLFLICFGF